MYKAISSNTDLLDLAGPETLTAASPRSILTEESVDTLHTLALNSPTLPGQPIYLCNSLTMAKALEHLQEIIELCNYSNKENVTEYVMGHYTQTNGKSIEVVIPCQAVLNSTFSIIPNQTD